MMLNSEVNFSLIDFCDDYQTEYNKLPDVEDCVNYVCNEFDVIQSDELNERIEHWLETYIRSYSTVI